MIGNARGSALDDGFGQASGAPGAQAPDGTARLAAGARRLVEAGAPALTLVYLLGIWVIFAGVILAIPYSGGGLGVSGLISLAGL